MTKPIGTRVNVVTIELRAMLDRLTAAYDYEACVLGVGGGDGDPTAKWGSGCRAAARGGGTSCRPLSHPHVLVGARRGLGNLRPTVFDRHALWNVDELFWRGGPPGAGR